MTRTRILILVLLASLPIFFLIGMGSYHLWQTGLWFWVWWPMALCWAAAYVLAWRWQRRSRLARADVEVPMHWTDRDRAAWKKVDARAALEVPAERLGQAEFYWQTSHEMALDLARVYEPEAKDPYGRLTVPEILAVFELASHDLNDLIQRYVPASHLLTVNHWKRAHGMIGWYRQANNVFWATSAILDPIRTGLRYLAAKYGLGKPLDKLQENVIGWFYSAFVQKVGYYLIELNSGRLRVGVKRYRELLREHGPPMEVADIIQVPEAPARTSAPPEARRVTITVAGQVKAGKSSLINALLGERLAQTDVVPATAEITRYELKPAGVPGGLFIFDTRGYGHAGPDADELAATEEAVNESDIIVLVAHALNPARQADADLLDRLKTWFEDRRHLKLPPVVVALTHIDLLKPSLEWSPPYDWHNGSRLKERQMGEAVAAASEQLGTRVTAVVPVCTEEGKVFNVEEGLLPAILQQLDEARGVSLLRALHAEADANKARRVWQQIKAAGGRVFELVRDSLFNK
jgi:predicted GTPase